MPTEEEFTALLTAKESELSGAKARISELNQESKNHRLNADTFRTQAEKAAKEATDAKAALDAKAAEIAAEKARIEGEAAEKVKAADEKSAQATTKAQERAINADLKVAAKDAGAHDAGDLLVLLDRSKIKLDADGVITNAAELMAELKTSKPHLFGAASTSNPNPTPPKKPTSEKPASEWTPEERSDFERRNGIRR